MFARFHKARAQRIGLVGDALPVAVKTLGIQRTDKIIPVWGEPFTCPTTGMTHFWFRRRGDDGEYHATVKLERNVRFKGGRGG